MMETELTAERSFAYLMREARLRQGLRQEDLAAALKPYGVDLHPTAISKMEGDTDQRMIRLNEAVAVAEVLGLSLDEMVEVEADRENALAWASRQFAPVQVEDTHAIADAVLALAERYRSWLAVGAEVQR